MGNLHQLFYGKQPKTLFISHIDLYIEEIIAYKIGTRNDFNLVIDTTQEPLKK